MERLTMKLSAWRDDLDVSDARLRRRFWRLLDGPSWVAAAETLPRLRRLCEEEGPEPLRRRGLLAPPDFLTAA
jgi:hypothetical protein